MKVFTCKKYRVFMVLGFLSALILSFLADTSQGTKLSGIWQLDPTLDFNLVVSAGYIADKDPYFASITGAVQDQVVLYVNDKVYVDRGARDGVEVNGVYVVYRLENEIINPGTKAVLGVKLQVLGLLQIASVENNRSLGIIISSYDIIYRADKVGLICEVMPDWHYDSLPSKDRPKIRGLIVESREHRALLGKYDIVYLNLGRDHGVGPRDRLRILHPLETFSFGNSESKFQKEIGELQVISSQKKSATAIIKASLEEITLPAIVERIIP